MKITVKFEHSHHGEKYPAGTILELPDSQARWLCDQKIDSQPCAEPYTGDAPAANQPKTTPSQSAES